MVGMGGHIDAQRLPECVCVCVCIDVPHINTVTLAACHEHFSFFLFFFYFFFFSTHLQALDDASTVRATIQTNGRLGTQCHIIIHSITSSYTESHHHT
jgi:hypothetical protein